MDSSEQVNLFEIVRRGDSAKTAELLFRGTDPCARGARNEPLLVAATRAGSEDIVELLAGSGCDVNDGDESGTTALIAAASKGLMRSLAVLLFFEAKPDLQDKEGRTALMCAARAGEREAILTLLSYGASGAIHDQNGMTALHHSVVEGHRNSTRSLIAASKHLNDLDREGNSALHFAAKKGDSVIVEVLLEAGADPNIRNVSGCTPLMLGVAKRKRKIVELLTGSGADVNFADTDGHTALMIAAFKGDKAVVEDLIRLGADPKIRDGKGMTALIHASSKGLRDDSTATVRGIGEKYGDEKFLVQGASHETQNSEETRIAGTPDYKEVVKTLVKNGSPVDSRDSIGQTALIRATQNGHTDLIEILIEGGADANAVDHANNTAIAIARTRNDSSAVACLEKHLRLRSAVPPTAEQNAAAAEKKLAGAMKSRDEGGKTPLIQACATGDLAIVKLLLEQGSEVNEKDFQGSTGLMIAASSGHVEIVRLLIQGGANVNYKTLQNFTALLLAIARKKSEAVKVLIEAGANINARIKGMSCLMLAVSVGDLESVSALIKAGADPNETNHRGQTAAAFAAAQGKKEVADYLGELQKEKKQRPKGVRR
ncbi:MAG: hypothetical protein A2X94_12475 [Bdellovibrionales bacterium GWB1_55_8]|nr:MAG: hypothetical protein A2X94_12475 [Bdellovibrionales bacterium GWB1_55_8]